VAIKTDSAAWTWGSNQFGQLGDGTVTYRSSPGQVAGFNSNWCQISAGWQVAGTSFTSAVKKDGTAWTWGANLCGQLGDGTTTYRSSPVSVSGGGTTWCDISSGANHTAAVKTDGTAWTWGRNTCGQLGDGSVVNRSSPVALAGVNANWCQINAGAYNTITIQSITF
jgi:alpha-tubulin suppressor-like RCC1 family protein